MILFLFEANPLLFIDQGFGLSAEYFVSSHLSLGAVGEFYLQEPYNTSGVEAKRDTYNIAPQARWYFFEGSGPFIGTKLVFAKTTAYISDPTETHSETINYMAPVGEVGYRFIFSDTVSFSMYLGLGVKTTSTTLSESFIPADRTQNAFWQAALSELNDNQSRTYVDYGFTLGFLF